MDIYIKNKEGITLHTQNKYCKEDIAVSVETDELNAIPSVENQTFEGLYSNVNIAGDENLVPENILKDKEIFGVKGTAESGGGDEELETSYASSIDGTLGTNITKIPSNLTSIRDYAFRDCTNLALTELPSGITSIGTHAFNGCTNLALTELPSNLTSIDTYAFYGCKNLALTELPSGVTSIKSQLFVTCTSLTEITCQGNITSIGSSAFYGCSNLIKFALPNVTSVPTLSTSVFDSTPIASGKGYIYVPDDLVNSFKTASNWSKYANQIKGISEMV